MALYVVKHEHSNETCPARNKEMGGMLLTHLSAENAGRNGLKINAEAVIDGAHTLYLIVEAEDEKNVKKFMEPFAMAGSVEVMPASVCEVVVERGSC
ncbi:MAG: sulfite oxidase [Bacteroidetes bacterium]|nr:sulfite oxidase [Bacteroidota bacterium]